MEHSLDVSAEMAAAALAATAQLSNRETILEHLAEVCKLTFDYDGHGALPIRPDAEHFLRTVVLDSSNDPLWQGLTLEAIGIDHAGGPFFQFVAPATGRRAQINVPCAGIVAWIQHLPKSSQLNLAGTGFDDNNIAPQIIGYTRLTSSLNDSNWLKVAAVINWCQSTIITRK